MTSYRFFKMLDAAAQYYLYLLMLLPTEGQRLSTNRISSTYLNWRL